MMEQRVDQLYCTHCTYRTAALHRREGASADQVFEESTRAGSVPRERSHDIFERFASCLLFHVPGDMLSEEMVQHDAHSLPLRRMIYLPAVGGYRLVGQICFRQKDTRGRPGAYFAHVLIQNIKEFPAPWSPLDCLRLWGSEKWVIEDSPDHPFDLPRFNQLQEFDPQAFAAESGSSINDAVLHSFLTAPEGTEFADGGAVIPERWQSESPAARRTLLVNLLQAVLNLDFGRREQLLIAVEPSVAALLFYGIIRLLPSVGLAEKLSFSTYESHRDKQVSTLAATCFRDPVKTDLSDDWYSPQSRVVAFNTYKPGRHTPPRRMGKYAPGMVDKFIAGGAAAVDPLLEDCAKLKVGEPAELETLFAVDGLVAQWLIPQSPEDLRILTQTLPREAGLRAFLREKLADSLDLSEDSSQFEDLLAHPTQAVQLFKLFTENLASSDSAKLKPAIDAMTARWHGDAVGELLSDKDIARDRKLAVLIQYYAAYRTLPPDAESLFFTKGSVCVRDRLLDGLLGELDGEDLHLFVRDTYGRYTSEECFCELLRGLSSHLEKPMHATVFRRLFRHARFKDTPAEQAQRITTALADRTLRKHVAKIEQPDDELFSNHLSTVLDQLPDAPQRLDQRLELLDDMKDLLPLVRQRRVKHWQHVSQYLKTLQQLNAEQPTFMQRMTGRGLAAEKDDAARQLTLAAQQALPPSLEEAEAIELITGLVKDVLGSSGIPEQFNARVSNVFYRGKWTMRGSGGTLGWLTNKYTIIGTVVVAGVLVAVLAPPLWTTSASTDESRKAITAPNNSSTEHAVADDDSKDPQEPPAEKPKRQSKLDKPDNKVAKATPSDVSDSQKPFQPTPATAPPQDASTTQSKTPSPVTAAIPVIDWKSHFELPELPHNSNSTDSSTDDQKWTTLQAWQTTDNQKSQTEDDVKRLLRDLSFKLIGAEELNDFLTSSTDQDDRGICLRADTSEFDDKKTARYLRIYKLSRDEDARLNQDATLRNQILQTIKQLCEFQLDSRGLQFRWNPTYVPHSRKLQNSLRYCWLELRLTSQLDAELIPLSATDIPVLVKAEAAIATTDDKSAVTRTFTAATWHMQLPANAPYGFSAFDWAFTKVKVTSTLGDDKSFEATLPLPDATQAATATNKLGSSLFEEVHLKFARSRDPNSKQASYSITPSVSVSVKQLSDLKKNKDALKELLERVLANPDSVVQDPAKSPASKNATPAQQPLRMKTFGPKFRPKDWVDKTIEVLNQSNPTIMQTIAKQPEMPAAADFTAKTTMDDLQKPNLGDQAAIQARNKFFNEYTTWVRGTFIPAASQEYARISKQLKASGGVSAAETQAIDYCNNIKSIEVLEMQRLVNKVWHVLPTAQASAAAQSAATN